MIHLLLSLWLAWAVAGGCAARRVPPPPVGVTWQPGSFVKDYFFAPGFAPARVSYALEPAKVEHSQGVASETFAPLFQGELKQAWEANGLRLSDEKPDCRLVITIHHLAVGNGRFRFLTGRTSASLTASGVITRNHEILFAFRDTLSLDSPVRPGPPAPKETELLLRRISRELAHHILNELLLHGLTADGMNRSAKTRTSNRGRFSAVVVRVILPA